MLEQKSNSWLKAKMVPLQQKLAGDAKQLSAQMFQRLFGLTQGWEKHRDIVQNNYNLGSRHLDLGNLRDAILRFKMVTWLDPKHADGWYKLGCAYVADDKFDLAKPALLRALQLKPDNEEVVYMMAIASGKDMPAERLPKKIPLTLARQHFDRLAPHFTQEQLETYNYQGHTLLANAVRASLTPGRIDHIVLELGVGSGLCGPLMRDVALQLIGVDISAPMLEEAAKLQDADGKKIYDALINREVLEFLNGSVTGGYDVVMAAELLSYIGDVSDMYPQVARVLKPGGIFAFTADKMDGAEFQLDPAAGRFLFSKSYLEAQAAANHFKIIKCEEAPIYPNYNGWLCVLARQ